MRQDESTVRHEMSNEYCDGVNLEEFQMMALK
jgi:hypothetical protein